MKIIETNLKFNSNHSDMSGNPKGYVLHHAAASTCSVEDVHRWHLANGWAGIGYHFFIRKDGSVYRGRPENWVGAHTSGYNDRIGICCEGNFETETMPAAQKNSVVELLKYLYAKYGMLEVGMHRQLDSTACPGKNYPFNEIVSLSKEKAPGSNSPENTAPQSGSLYRVQAGAFAKKENAEALLAKIKAAGYESFITEAGGLYKVQTGAFSRRTNAETQLTKLKALGFEAFITGGSKKSIEEIAKEVIAGKWGNGQERTDRLEAAGYDSDAVQEIVNSLLKG